MADEAITETISAPEVTTEESGSRTESESTDEFKPIGSQEEFDKAVKGRIARAEKAAEKKLSGRVTELEGIVHAHEQEKLTEDQRRDARIEELTSALAERDTTIAKNDRDKLVADLADEKKLPRKLWDRVRGDSDEEILADIDLLLETVPAKADPGTGKSGKTITVTPTGATGDKEQTAAEIIAAIDPSFKP